MQKTNFFFIMVLTILLSGCGSRKTVYEGVRFPETSTSDVTFQEHAIPADCSAFAHLLMNTKIHSSGYDIAEAMQLEAQEKGANLILVGMARTLVEEELKTNRFDYYGPKYVYNFNKTWLGWKFGFDAWNDGDKLVGLGSDRWGSTDIHFDHSLLIKAVFLRCGEKL